MSDPNASGSGVVVESSGVRVAIEGCVSLFRSIWIYSVISSGHLHIPQGHGCLHSIYASVERAAALKGWDGVDLLIIGGDFQVRFKLQQRSSLLHLMIH